MPNIPTVPGSELDVSTVGPGFKQNLGALNAPFRGRMAVAGAVEGMGDFFERLGADMQRAKNAGIAADVDLNLRQARQSFLEGLKNDSDETNWTQRAAEMSDQVQDKILGESTRKFMGPDMRRQTQQAFNNWKQSLMIETETMAHMQTINRSWQKNQADYQEALKDGDAQHAKAVLDNSRKAKLADPAEIDQLERNIPKELARNAIEHGLGPGGNPKKTFDLLQSGAALPVKGVDGKDIDPKKVFNAKEYDQISNEARARMNEWQAVNFKNMLVDKEDKLTGFVPDDVIEKEKAEGNIDPRAADNLKASQDRKIAAAKKEEARVLAAQDKQVHDLITSRAFTTEAWKADPEGYAHTLIQDAAHISDPAERGKTINMVNRQLESIRKKGETEEAPLHKQIIGLMRQDFETQGRMVPMMKEETPEKTGVALSGPFSLRGTYTPGETRFTPISGGMAGLKQKFKALGDDDALIKESFGATRDEIIDAANVHAAKLEMQMREWFQSPEGRNATFEQANKHRQEIEKPWVMEGLRQSLKTLAPAVITSKEDFDNLPSGARFVWNGQTGIKN